MTTSLLERAFDTSDSGVILHDDTDEGYARQLQNGKYREYCQYSEVSGAPNSRTSTASKFDSRDKNNSNVIPPPILACWKLLRESGFSKETFQQIVSVTSNRLIRADQGLRPLSTETLKAFLNFWSLCGDEAAEPQIMISPKGNLQAEWWTDGENFVVIEFQPNKEVFFSLWQDNYVTEGRKAAKKMRELVHIFDAMDDNPLGWFDAA